MILDPCGEFLGVRSGQRSDRAIAEFLLPLPLLLKQLVERRGHGAAACSTVSIAFTKIKTRSRAWSVLNAKSPSALI